MQRIHTGILLIGFYIIISGCSNNHGRQCSPYPTSPHNNVIDQTYIHKYGVTIPQEEWVDRGEEGTVVSTLKEGVVVTENYAKGNLEGETTYTFPNSETIQFIETFSGGQLVQERENLPSGTPRKQVEYLPSDVKTITVWYESGAPHYRELYKGDRLIEADYYDANNQVESRIDQGQGKRINRDEFEQLISTDEFNNGEKILSTTYYSNGAIKEIIPYRDGNIHGQKKIFLPDGEPKAMECWENDQQHGITVVFQNGEKIAEVPYINGLKQGVEKRFSDDDHLVEEITWRHGLKHGPCYRYLGEDTHVTWVYHGREVSQLQYCRLVYPHMR
ncbi:MAG: hypothetical protein WB791_07620 [Waddliaceae bacterium]